LVHLSADFIAAAAAFLRVANRGDSIFATVAQKCSALPAFRSGHFDFVP
jgi:hypothetical protein